MKPGPAAAMWAGLDEPWREAFRLAWEAFRTGNVAVGACAATTAGEIVRAARNRVNDHDGPHGEIFGSTLAHAEMNVLAGLSYRGHQDLVLTTTLEPCLQCAAAIRLSQIGAVRFAGADRYWDGCHDFGKLSPREAQRGHPARIGPRPDELGAFATLIARLGPGRGPKFEDILRALGEGPTVDLANDLEMSGAADRLSAMPVDQAFAYLWTALTELTAASGVTKPLKPDPLIS